MPAGEIERVPVAAIGLADTGPPVGVVALAALQPLVVAGGRIRHRLEAPEGGVVVALELAGRAALVDVAEVEEGVGRLASDERRDGVVGAFGDRTVADRPDRRERLGVHPRRQRGKRQAERAGDRRHFSRSCHADVHADR